MFTEGITGYVFIPLIIIAALFILKRASDQRRQRSFFSFGDFNAVFYVFIMILLILSAASALNLGISFDLRAWANDNELTGNFRYKQYLDELTMLKDPRRMQNHYRVLLARDKAIEEGSPSEVYNFFDGKIDAFHFYSRLQLSADRQMKNAGNLGLALLALNKNKTEALKLLRAISDSKTECVQLIYARLEEHPAKARDYLEKEISNKGAISDAVPLLASVYYNSGETEALYNLANNKQTAVYVPGFYRTFIALEKFDALRRIPVLLKMYFQQKNLFPVLIALFVIASFIFLFHYTSAIKVRVMLLWSCGSVLFFLLVTPLLFDLLHRRLQFRQNGEALNDFAYFTAGIALTEELLKSVPFILAAVLFSRKKDPATYFSFALLSGAAFAFSETIIHSDGRTAVSVAANAIWLSLIHIITSGISAYFLIVARFKWQRNEYQWILPAICVAAIIHGVYDYCMANENIIVSLLILITGIGITGVMMNNVLSNSAFSKAFGSLNYSKIISAFVSLNLIVLLAEYGFQYFNTGVYSANYILSDALKTLSVPVTFFSIRLAQTDVFPGKWQQLQLFSALNPFPFLFRRHVDFSAYLGKQITINGARKNKQLLKQLPAQGIIKERELISGYPGWFVVELKKPLMMNNQLYRSVLFRTIEKYTDIKPNRNTGAAVYILPESSEEDEKKQEDLIFLDWVLIN